MTRTMTGAVVLAAAQAAIAQQGWVFQVDRTVLTPSRSAADVRLAAFFPAQDHAFAGAFVDTFIERSLEFEVLETPLSCGAAGCPYEITARGVEGLGAGQLNCFGFAPDPANPIMVMRLEVRGSAGVGQGVLTTASGRFAVYPSSESCSEPEDRIPTEAEVLIAFTDCEADCDTDGELTFFDFLCFQDLFAAGDGYADCDGSGQIDFFDFLCSQNDFMAGCA